jgi:hypothetical protein
MFWRRDMSHPVTLQMLEVWESAWLNSGDDDEYGFNSSSSTSKRNCRATATANARKAFAGGNCQISKCRSLHHVLVDIEVCSVAFHSYGYRFVLDASV